MATIHYEFVRKVIFWCFSILKKDFFCYIIRTCLTLKIKKGFERFWIKRENPDRFR